MNEIEALNNKIYNLSLYLDYVRQEAPTLWEEMNVIFDGMPGWTEREAHFEYAEEEKE